jgi:hypothetical protein
MVCPATMRSADAQRYLDQLCQADACIARAYGLIQAFLPWSLRIALRMSATMRWGFSGKAGSASPAASSTSRRARILASSGRAGRGSLAKALVKASSARPMSASRLTAMG